VSEQEKEEKEKEKEVVTVIPSSPTTTRDDVLRQRLKKAMGSVGG
jgi:hypothetical protein